MIDSLCLITVSEEKSGSDAPLPFRYGAPLLLQQPESNRFPRSFPLSVDFAAVVTGKRP
jgi:hypothetical protein